MKARVALTLVGAAVLWMASACASNGRNAPEGGGGGGATSGAGGSGGAAGAAVCVPNADAVKKTLADYLASQAPCTLDADCTVVDSFHIQECQGWCTLAVRADAVDGLWQIASLPCTTCKQNARWYPECLDSGIPSAVCNAGKCEVSFPASQIDEGVDADTPDAATE